MAALVLHIKRETIHHATKSYCCATCPALNVMWCCPANHCGLLAGVVIGALFSSTFLAFSGVLLVGSGARCLFTSRFARAFVDGCF